MSVPQVRFSIVFSSTTEAIEAGIATSKKAKVVKYFIVNDKLLKRTRLLRPA